MPLTLIIIGASLTVFLLVTGLALAVTSPRGAVIDRLGRATSAEKALEGEKADKAGLKEDFYWVLGQLGRFAPGKGKINAIRTNLSKAAILMRPEEYIGLTLLTGVGFYALLLVITDSIILGLIGGAIGLAIPGMLVNSKKRKRSAAMTDELPEALNIISSGLRAGFSFPQALSIVNREMEGPLQEEFSRVLKENRLGKPMDEALNDFLDRIENEDIELLVTALLIQRQVGGNLAEVLDSISHTIRERVRIKGEIKTLTAEGRLSAIILSLLPVAVALLISIMNTEYIMTLIREPIGIAMIVGAVILQVIGVFIIRKIVAIDV